MPSDRGNLSRKMVAILHADVTGSTGLVQLDEALTHQRINDAFQRFSQSIERYGGTVHEIRGDALVAVFPRASDAVCAAMSFQLDNKRVKGEISDSVKPSLRVGISLGEVIIADNTITGVGIVLAQRLEQLAPSDGVIVQASVAETVPRRLPFEFESLGEQTLKGLDTQVRAALVKIKNGNTVPEPEPLSPFNVGRESREAVVYKGAAKPSIAILPFLNISGDPEQEYFSDGITIDIITELSRFRSLLVIAKNSSFHFKGKSLDVREVGSELDVQYIVEGSVRKHGNRVRVTAQLSDCENGVQIWAERYDRDLEDVFEVQDELVRAIVSTVGGRVEDAGKTRVERNRDTGTHAYDLYLRARAAQDRNTPEDYQRAHDYLEEAVKVDPGFAQAYQNLSLVLFMQWMAHWVEDRDSVFEKSMNAAKKAVEIDPADSSNYARLGTLHMNRREFKESGQNFRTAISLNPSDSQALALYGVYLTAVGEPESAIEQFDKAIRLNPFAPSWFRWSRGIANFTASRYQDAVTDLTSLNSPINEARCWLAASLAHAGEIEKARLMLEEFFEVAKQEMAIFPGRKLEDWKDYWHGAIEYESESHFEHLYDGLRKAGFPD